MTRINCVPVTELSGKHLLAEYRELPRVYALAVGAYNRREPPPALPKYILGPGHVRFFYDRMTYVRTRHAQLIEEMHRRHYKATMVTVPTMDELPPEWHNDWEPTRSAMRANRARLKERTPDDYV